MPTPIDAAVVIRNHPCPTFDKITPRGYTVEYWFEECPGVPGRDLNIQVRNGDEVIAGADFTDDPDGGCAYNQNVTTLPAYRRQGLANAMYVLAEIILGKTLVNFWEDVPDFQSKEAKALWAQPNRPFGYPKRP